MWKRLVVLAVVANTALITPCEVPVCGINEVYDTCANGGCQKRNCSQVGEPILCIDPIKCIGGCVCEQGYLRNKNGICVPADQCPQPDCPKNEVFDTCANGGCKRLECSELTGPIICRDPLECIGDCVCVNGFLRNEDGFCVPESECNPQCNRPHEIFNPCPSTCPPQTCESLDRAYICPIEWRQDPLCEPGCVCEKGYFRNKIGECISQEDCLKCMGPHEYFSCGGACDNVCDTLSEQNQTNCPIVNIQCNEMCYCEEGYARDGSNICVPIEECPVQCTKPHEVYDPCPLSCPPQICAAIGIAYPCPYPFPPDGEKFCQPACRCEDGYYRNYVDECISEADCLKCMGPHEYFSCGGACDNVCDTLSEQNQTNCPIVNIQCNEMCYCEEGYARNGSNICVPIEECPVQCTKPHEVYDPCPLSCPPQTCAAIGIPYPWPCPYPPDGEEFCQPACRCEDGYYRNSVDECISEADCLKCMGPHEYFSCGGACDNVCDTLSEQNQTNCPIVNIQCNEMCYCEEGYARNGSNICVPIEECPVQCTQPHEVYDPCPLSCPPQTCAAIGIAYPCPYPPHGEEFCQPACRCEDGYYRNYIDECISEADCLKCMGPHEYFSCGGACDNVCDTLSEQNQTNCPIVNIQCNEMCYCEEGYARNGSNICVPIEECPVQCTKPHEVYDPCPLSCPPQTCAAIGIPYPWPCPYPPDGEEFCQPACRCEDGYYRNSVDECISEADCLKCMGPHEYFSCGGACDNVCDTLSEQNQTNCPIVNIQCNEMCYCEEGYARNGSNICVPIEECPVQCTQPHEVYDPCPLSCPPQTCAAIGIAYPCPYPPHGEEFCQPACRCEDGYYRNYIDECISEADCLKCMGPHEYFSCGGACDNVCDTLSEQNQTNCPIVNIQCNEMCYCEEGYARNGSNICVPIEECPVQCTLPHEVYDPCPLSCPPQTCAAIGIAYPCPYPPHGEEFCQPACRCEDGYYRNYVDECISEADCLKCMGPHEYFSCGGACDNVCDTLSEQNQTNCPIVNIQCNEMCYCEEGYARNGSNICVPIEECPVQCTQPHELYDPCPLSCPPQTCAAIGIAYPCPYPPHGEEFCQPACRCEDGYYRNYVDECISEADCLKCMGPHEYFSCGGACDNVCDTLSEQNQTNCPIVNIQCNEMCYCEEGYARNGSNICVPIEECPVQCTKPHEVYDPCPLSCPPQTCAAIGIPYPWPCPYPPDGEEFCQPACRCEDGYYRNSVDECISEADCLKCMGPHEYFSCGGACDNVCDTLSEQNQTNCPIVNIQCNEMCYCEEGYARNGSNICVPIEECPVQCTQPHELYDPCPLSCPPQTCAAIGIAYPCPYPPHGEEFCQPACRCEDGYYRNYVDECISEANCLKCMGPHEYFSCGGACDNVCDTLSEQNQTNCPIVNIQCNEMCYCEEGYARNGSNICVPIEECPVQCTQPHEVYDPCPLSCPPQICAAIGIAYPCPYPPHGEDFCQPACRCEDGYYRNYVDECISEADCLKCMGPHEYFSCGGACDNVCDTLSEQNQTNCPIVNIQCNEMCYCEEGYARNGSNICVPIDECPVKCYGEHKVFDPCPKTCPPQTCESLNNVYICCPETGEPKPPCEPGCVCEEGYYENSIGQCLTKEECLQCTKPHEVYDLCPYFCPPQTCAAIGIAIPCVPPPVGNEFCQPSCRCEDGYYRNSIDECISEADCLRCTGPHEYYSCGGACDNVCETLNEQSQANCPIVNIKCNEMCYCEEGYARNASNICIPIKDCPPSRCGPDERYEESPCQVCEPLTCCEVGMEMECPPVEDNDCDDTPACICKHGFVRNDEGVCIPISECPE